MAWSVPAPGHAIFTNPRVMGKVGLGEKGSKVGDAMGKSREVRELHAAGQHERAYDVAIKNRLASAVSFLYVEEHKAHTDRFLELTGNTEWDGVLLCRNLAFARMDPIPPRGLADARRLCKAPDQKETGQPGPALYGFRTLIKDAENRADPELQLQLLYEVLIAGQLSATLTPEVCKVARLHRGRNELRGSLAFWVLAW